MISSVFSRFGPGLLYASAAVGTSHLIQSTRAGADFGFGLLLFMILIPIIKYPGIRFGNDYTVATGKTLIHSYVSLGKPAVVLYTLIVFVNMAFVTTALTLVTSGLLKASIASRLSVSQVGMLVLLATSLMLITGRYKFLETLNKFLVPVFSVIILFVTVVIALRTDWATFSFALPVMTAATIMTIVQLAGWLLTPMEGSVNMSVWTAKKMDQQGDSFSKSDSVFDFNVGYWLSLLLALCFLLMGAAVFYGQGITLPQKAGPFLTQIITIFSDVIGTGSFALVTILAITVMYSTLLTVVDSYARNLEILVGIVRLSKPTNDKPYQLSVILVMLSSFVVVNLFLSSFTTFIDLVGALVFILGPGYAILNHLAMISTDVPFLHRPSRFMLNWSLLGIFIMMSVAILYIYLRWLS